MKSGWTAVGAVAVAVGCGATGGGGSGAATDGGGTVDTGGADTSHVDASSGGDSGQQDSTPPPGDACSPSSAYDPTILCDHPVAYWAMSKTQGTEPDATGHGNTGTYKGGNPTATTMPNGDPAVVFDGSSQYLTVPSNTSMSIPTTGNLTWEGWIRPDVLQFPHDGSDAYVDWMGKCDQYSPTCEWEARMYDTTTKDTPNRCNRLSAYVFNPSAGLGSAADWQPNCGLVTAGQWLQVVGEYTTLTQPADCPSSPAYPGSINIWVNGVPWSQSNHNPTGCMSQYNVVPKANGSAVNIGTMALDTWFQGAIGKVAIYDYLLTAAQITAHYALMTGKQPTGSCANTCTL
jgi:hypothetical protein